MEPIHTIGVFLRPLTHSLKQYFFEFQDLAKKVAHSAYKRDAQKISKKINL